MRKDRKVLIIQLRPEEETSDGEFYAILKFGNLTASSVERHRAEHKGLVGVDPRNYSAIIVGGSPFDLTKDQSLKSAQQIALEGQFQEFLKIVVDEDIPFLGLCSGNGLLGRYCGAIISTKYAEPVAGQDIMITDEGAKDPLLSGLPRKFRALAGHKEACEDVPPGAVLLASTESCPVHMFRIKNNVYATQFHPEADAEVLTLRIWTYKNHGYFLPEEAKRVAQNIEHENTEHAQEILRRFIEKYREV